MYFVRLCSLILTLSLLAGCGDNLLPSGEDQRPPVQTGTTGPAVGQQAPVFSVADTNGNIFTLTSALANRKAIVLYFTMWCPICDAHASNLQEVIPSFPTVGFYLVDYVSGTVADARSAMIADGFADSGFTTLADIGNHLLFGFQGTMGSTVVIDSGGTILLNEDYKDGTRLQAVLASLP